MKKNLLIKLSFILGLALCATSAQAHTLNIQAKSLDLLEKIFEYNSKVPKSVRLTAACGIELYGLVAYYRNIMNFMQPTGANQTSLVLRSRHLAWATINILVASLAFNLLIRTGCPKCKSYTDNPLKPICDRCKCTQRVNTNTTTQL